jgi:hypothetical protein
MISKRGKVMGSLAILLTWFGFCCGLDSTVLSYSVFKSVKMAQTSLKSSYPKQVSHSSQELICHDPC